MARFQEKEKVFSKHPKLEKALFWSLIALFAALAVALVVIIVLMIIGPKDDEDEKITYEETYKTAELLTYEELAKCLDNDIEWLPDGVETVYVYLYSPDYTKGEDGEIINEDELDGLRAKINECITAYSGDEDNNGCAFYVINTLAEENTDYIASNSSFLSTHGIESTTPALLAIANTKDGISIVEDIYADVESGHEVGEFINYLTTNVIGKERQ